MGGDMRIGGDTGKVLCSIVRGFFPKKNSWWCSSM